MKTETIYFTCDICNAIDAEELRYAIRGREYALDVCSTCRMTFDNLMAPYVDKSRKVKYGGHTIRRDAPRSVKGPQPLAQDGPPRTPGRPRKMAPTTP